MKTILTIGYQNFLLADGTNVNTILKALAGAKKVDRRYEHRRNFYKIEPDPVEVSVEMVQPAQVIPAKVPKAIAEQASPDAHGKDFFRPEGA